MAAAHDQCEGREADFSVFEQHRVNVPFDVIGGDQRQLAGEAQRLGVSDTHQQRADQPGALSDSDCTEVFQTDIGFGKRLLHYGYYGSQVFSRGQFRNDAAVPCVSVQLRSHNARSHLPAIHDNGGGSFVARAFDS